ncbi:MAG: outer membrane protein assembly factor [Flavisolibacter sp.]
MQRYLSGAFLSVLCALAFSSHSQDTSRVTSVDPELLNLQTAKVPKEYTIRSVKVSGITTLDTSIVLSISGLQPGDKVQIPGSDAFSKAITNLWRQRFFSNAQIYITAVHGDFIDLELDVLERPKLGNFQFLGIKKSEKEELQGKIGLVKGTIITENTKRNATEVIDKYYRDKGFMNVLVTIDETKDPLFKNANSLTFHIDKGNKVRVNEINFFGNESVSDIKLKKEMKGTHEMSKLTLRPDQSTSPYGSNERMSFKEYMKDMGFLSPSKTKAVLDPYLRIKLFSSAKFDEKKYEEDKNKVLEYYNSIGFRDAQIANDTLIPTKEGNLQVNLRVSEGDKYYFGNISWKGNTKYSDSVLSMILAIHKGDIYNIDLLNKRLGKQVSPEGGADISSLYMDEGYLFFNVDPVETSVYNDTIDYEIRVREGTQARYKNISITGNEKTKDYVIRRELRTLPGELFSRSDIIRSQRELAALSYFNQEKIAPDVVPNQEDGTVDINWQLEEKSSDQLELSAGWGGGVGLTGTLGVTFNNFSIKNIFNREAWDPLPQGDGQKLSLRYQSNGRAYSSYNFSFTEPWLGGKKRNSLTVSIYHSKFSNAYDYTTGQFDKARSDTNYLKTTGASISMGKQLKWPDDYFSLIYSVNFTRYDLRNYPGFLVLSDGTDLMTGTSTGISFKLGLQRSSVYDPTFPRSGSNISASVQFTPPYSYLNPALVTSNNPYKNPEYHKWRFNAEWFVPIGKPMGADKNRQFVLKMSAKYGFMGRYNQKLDFSPFERFQLGGDGLTNSYGLLGYDVISLRGYPVFDNSDPSINNPDQTSSNKRFTIFNKYSLELRYPLVTNPSSNIYALTFFDAANGWYSFKEYNPFRLRRAVGVGMRFFLPMFGLLGFDYGVGLDRIQPGATNLKNATKFTFMLGYEPE